ncbi:helicase SKI2W-like [Crassostrea angulata]|uniref:helicase SKI2W-like n=1 Tax=Magallana angulata TaxID=2784310 RepID=UPI0022B11035|nr:helicase SKI2W-like [Crassostrea angulata]XP_052720163.1 helicase SKI2W-like [Crassostrea angulata]
MDLKGLGVDFDLAEVGCQGKFVPVPKRKNNEGFPRKTLPAGLPPILPSWGEELEDYLTCIEQVPVHDLNSAQRFWPREPHPENLYHAEVSGVQTTIQVDRNPTTGELLGYKEEYLESTSEGKTSLSLRRPPGPAGQDVRGSSANFPFLPGGMEEVETMLSEDKTEFLDFEKDLLSVAPGMMKGMTFNDLDIAPKQKEPTLLNLADLMSAADLDEFNLGDDEDEGESKNEDHDQGHILSEVKLEKSESLENLVKIDEDRETERGVRVGGEGRQEEWAVKVDVDHPVADFHQRIPDMAYKWEFELDVFQKQAILHLENHESVFVAAHTSAGKTVVAEYAIALSMKHMTRTVYTSPIKALSNQKYREFKQTFGEVGLITGDVQINQTASCLIMTTEILRSMLYNGSDVIRDLEWVIFDEVHYINDAERGVVWEEVLIMLPQHVNIILLSATVPNTLEFADWIGRTKKKKIFVISTLKRPIPLEHHLYTGTTGKTSNELFLIVDGKKNFLTSGYNKALEAKKEKSKSSQGFGPKGTRGGHPNKDKNIWISVIDMLKKKDKLPAVAFTFSKKKIDENAQNLLSKDLTTASEKSEIHIFFHSAIKKLKPPDQKLPQVLQMESLLKNGIGVHHSGILPILKEVVEMLFQRALVKILFSTETFAMGVNMPARTVVFDSIRKNDGTCFRDLLPGEYIQMAGRAGRRGLDTTGTVIILCKGDVPEMSDLHKMMLGKPTKLESQFRLTYSMILNLLRVEQLRVEDMMKRSFSEFHHQKDVSKHKVTIDQLHKQIAQIRPIECYLCSVDLEKYHESCRDYQCLRRKLQEVVLSHPAAIKALTAGRVIVISNSFHSNQLGIILNSTMAANNERVFTCLVLCDKNKSVKSQTEKVPGSEEVTPVTNTDLFLPEAPCGHDLVQVKAKDISMVTVKSIRVEANKIMDDIKKRQMPRFKDDPPGKSVTTATQELLRMVESNIHGLAGLDPVKDLHLRDIDLVEQFRSLQLIEDSFRGYQCINCPHFTEHFREHDRNVKLKEEYKHLKFLLSDESLMLLPEYEQRVQVLKHLNYIDENNAVQLKGRVACEISNHEIMITELVFENILTKLHPTEIAALLSCVVFEQKNCSEPKLAPELVKGKDSILFIAQKITAHQRRCGMNLVGDYEDEFKFGLMEVVFEWARGLPFAEITGLTDVQEGIIVRCIQRLHETLRDVRNAARIIGDPVLYRKMEEASQMIKRDIVFAASLYTQ